MHEMELCNHLHYISEKAICHYAHSRIVCGSLSYSMLELPGLYVTSSRIECCLFLILIDGFYMYKLIQ